MGSMGLSNHFCDTLGNPLLKWRGSLWGTFSCTEVDSISSPGQTVRGTRKASWCAGSSCSAMKSGGAAPRRGEAARCGRNGKQLPGVGGVQPVLTGGEGDQKGNSWFSFWSFVGYTFFCWGGGRPKRKQLFFGGGLGGRVNLFFLTHSQMRMSFFSPGRAACHSLSFRA